MTPLERAERVNRKSKANPARTEECVTEEIKDAESALRRKIDEIEALQQVEVERVRMIDQAAGNLLAAIHGDGGHHLVKHGWEQSCVDAILKYHEIVRRADERADDSLDELDSE